MAQSNVVAHGKHIIITCSRHNNASVPIIPMLCESIQDFAMTSIEYTC